MILQFSVQTDTDKTVFCRTRNMVQHYKHDVGLWPCTMSGSVCTMT